MKLIPLWLKIAGPLLLLAVIIFAARSCTATTNHTTDAGLSAAKSEGAATAAATAATKGLQNVEDGNKAAVAVGSDDDARRAGCLRHSRTPENC